MKSDEAMKINSSLNPFASCAPHGTADRDKGLRERYPSRKTRNETIKGD